MLIPGLLMGRVLLAKIREVGPATAQATTAAVRATREASQFRASASVRASAAERIRERRRAERERLAAGARPAAALATHAPSQHTLSKRKPYETELREEEDLADTGPNEDWLPIYRYAFIIPSIVAARLKIYVTLVALSSPFIADETGGELWAAIGLSVGLMAVVYHITTRLIGVISIHSRKDAIRVGYLNFWGSRRNAVIPVGNVIPLADYLDADRISLFDLKVDLRRYDAKGSLYLPTVGAEIVDPDAFEYVFGHSVFTKGHKRRQDAVRGREIVDEEEEHNLSEVDKKPKRGGKPKQE